MISIKIAIATIKYDKTHGSLLKTYKMAWFQCLTKESSDKVLMDKNSLYTQRINSKLKEVSDFSPLSLECEKGKNVKILIEENTYGIFFLTLCI